MLIADRIGPVTTELVELATYLAGFTVGTGGYGAVVVSSRGDFIDNAGKSDGLSSSLDRLWLKTLRARADVIVTTGATVRAEKLAQPSGSFLIASQSGDISGLRPAPGSELLIASSVSSHQSWPNHAMHLGSFESLDDVVLAAAERWQNLQLEFGAATLARLSKRRIIDRAFITAPNPTAVKRWFSDVELLFSIERLSVYSGAN